MPAPVINQPISRGPGAALPAIWEGSAKMPLPIMDPTTRAVRAGSASPAAERRLVALGVLGPGLVSWTVICGLLSQQTAGGSCSGPRLLPAVPLRAGAKVPPERVL